MAGDVPTLARGYLSWLGEVPTFFSMGIYTGNGVPALMGVVLTLTGVTFLSWGYLPLIGGGYLPWSGGCTFLGDLRKYFSLGGCDGPERIFLFGRMCWPCQMSKNVKLLKRCQVVKKMSNVKKSNIWTMQEVHKK